MHNEENVEANVTVENTIKNEIVEQPENLSTLKNKGEIAKVRSVYTDENFKTVQYQQDMLLLRILQILMMEW